MKSTFYMIDSKLEAHLCSCFADACREMQREVIKKGGDFASAGVCERDSKGAILILDYLERKGRSLIDPEFVPAGYPAAVKKAVARFRSKAANK